MITWYREVLCSNCNNIAFSHVNVLLTLLPNGETYIVGAFNVCENKDCAIALHDEAKDAIDFSGTEQHVWYDDDSEVRNLRWFTLQL